MSDVRNKVRELREKAGMSVTDLAKAVGLSTDQLSKRERGIRTLDEEEILNLCKALSCTSDELLGRTIEKNLKLISNNLNPAKIDEEIYRITKEAVLDILEGNKISLSEDELLNEIYRAYNIALEIKEETGKVKATSIAAKWAVERNKK